MKGIIIKCPNCNYQGIRWNDNLRCEHCEYDGLVMIIATEVEDDNS